MQEFTFKKEEVYSKSSSKKFVYKVSFEKILHHIFKDTFKSACWSKNEKVWVVGSRSLKKLQQFKSEVNASGFIEALEKKYEAELKTEELEKLNNDLYKLTEELKRSEDELSSTLNNTLDSSTVLALIATKKTELTNSVEQIKSAKAKEKDENKIIEDKISLIIDVDSIFEAASEMCRYSTQKRYSEEFYNERQVFINQAKLLEDAGLESAGLNKFSNMNQNRFIFKTENWKDLTKSMLFNISEI